MGHCRTILKSIAFSALAALAQAAAPRPALAQFNITVPAAAIAAQLQQTLGGTTVHLHNKGPLTNGSYHLADASSIKVPAKASGVLGQRTRFTIPDESRVILGRRYGYYVDRVRSNGFFVAANADSFTFSITLAAQGPAALVGTCVRLRSPVQPCSTLGESALPGIEWNNARVDVVVKPVVSGGQVAMDVQSVTIGGTFDVGNACDLPLVGTRLCAAINRKSEKIRARVAQEVRSILNSRETRQQVAAGVRAYLDTQLNEPLVSVASIDMANGFITIRPRLGR